MRPDSDNVRIVSFSYPLYAKLGGLNNLGGGLQPYTPRRGYDSCESQTKSPTVSPLGLMTIYPNFTPNGGSDGT